MQFESFLINSILVRSLNVVESKIDPIQLSLYGYG